MPIRKVYADFGMRVRKRRAELGLTQSVLAEQIGLTRASIANIEAGRQTVLLHQFIDLVHALECDPLLLLPADDRGIDLQPDKLPQDLPTEVQRFVGELSRRQVAIRKGAKP